MQECHAQSNKTLERQLDDVSIKDVPKPKLLKAEVISFSGQPKSEAFPSALSVTAVANLARTNRFTPPWEMPACAFTFPIQFDQPIQGQNSWAGVDFGMLSNFTQAQFSSVAQSCLTLRDLMDCSTPGLPAFPSPGDLPNPGIKPRSPALQADSLLTAPPEYVH